MTSLKRMYKDKLFNRHLVSLQAYLYDDSELKTLIQICDLHPDSWKVWKCPFGMCLKPSRKRLYARPSKPIKHIDIYAYASPNILVYSSKIIAYLDDHLALWGDDEKLRVFSYDEDIDSSWRRVSALKLPLESIRKLIRFDRSGLTHDPDGAYGSMLCRLPPTNESFKYLQTSNEGICQNRLTSLIAVF